MSDLFSDLLSIGKKIMAASEAIQAEIDRHSPTQTPTESHAASDSATARESATSSAGHINYSDLYRHHLQQGCRDPLELLSAEEASRLMGCPIAKPSTTGEEEYIGAHYGCTDDRSMYVALCVSALMPWDYIKNEVTTEPAQESVGDEALVSGEVLYVRRGASFFWLYGRGVDSSTIYDVARHVAERLA